MGSTSPIEAESGDNGDNGDKGGSSSSWDRTSKTWQTMRKSTGPKQIDWASILSIQSISGTNKKKHGNCHNLPKNKKMFANLTLPSCFKTNLFHLLKDAIFLLSELAFKKCFGLVDSLLDYLTLAFPKAIPKNQFSSPTSSKIRATAKGSMLTCAKTSNSTGKTTDSDSNSQAYERWWLGILTPCYDEFDFRHSLQTKAKIGPPAKIQLETMRNAIITHARSRTSASRSSPAPSAPSSPSSPSNLSASAPSPKSGSGSCKLADLCSEYFTFTRAAEKSSEASLCLPVAPCSEAPWRVAPLRCCHSLSWRKCLSWCHGHPPRMQQDLFFAHQFWPSCIKYLQ